jgi:hypothetical protein
MLVLYFVFLVTASSAAAENLKPSRRCRDASASGGLSYKEVVMIFFNH